MASGTVNVNVEIRGLPLRINRILNALARIRGTTKRIIVREALVEYATRHSHDLEKIADAQGLTTTDEDE
jgi:hypothetical protein